MPQVKKVNLRNVKVEQVDICLIVIRLAAKGYVPRRQG